MTNTDELAVGMHSEFARIWEALGELANNQSIHYRGTSAIDFTTTTLPHHGDYGWQTTADQLQMNCSGVICTVVTFSSGDGRYVELDGSNEALWIPNPTGDATQDITGHFNLAGAALTYKINGAHALSMPGTGTIQAGSGQGDLGAGGDDVTTLGLGIAPLCNVYNSMLMGSGVLAAALGAGNSDSDVIIGRLAAGGGEYNAELNVIIGDEAGKAITTGSYNVIGGADAAFALTTGSHDAIWGEEAGLRLTTAWDTTLVGYMTGAWLTTAHNNTFVGSTAGFLSTGSDGVRLGFESGYFETGSSKLFIDNIRRANEADARVKALVYGVFHANTASQSLRINGYLTVLEGQAILHNDGLDIGAAGDADADLITVNVTDAPTMGWREVQHTFTYNAAQHLTVTAHEFGYQAIDINVDAYTYGGVSGLAVNYDATAFVAGILGTALDMIVNNAGASGGEIHALDVAVSDPTNSDMITYAVGTHEGVGVIHQHVGEPANLTSGIEGDQSGGPSYTDRTAAFDASGTNVQIFDDDDDFILLASATKWDEINVLLATPSSTNIAPTFFYVTDAGAWVAFMPSDDTDGFQNSGTIRFDQDTLTTWGVRTISEVTSAALPGGDDYYWIKITRTRNNVVTPPTESTIHVTATGTLYEWDSEARLAIRTYSQAGEPDAADLPAGKFCFWTDTDDAKLYLCYNHGGTIKTVEMT